MTEEEWLSSTDPTPMLEFLRGKASERKLRLFAVACARRCLHQAEESRSVAAVEIAEGFADGLVANRRRGTTFSQAKTAALVSPQPYQNARYAAAYSAHANLHTASSGACLNGQMAAGFSSGLGYQADLQANERKPQASLLRDIFGNPFRPVTLDPSWLGSTVTTLARQMYDTRDFSAMPILADALQDAGCEDEQVLSHCRGGGVHVRGCFLVDILTGRE